MSTLKKVSKLMTKHTLMLLCCFVFFPSLGMADVTLTVGDSFALPGSDNNSVTFYLENQSDKVSAGQMDICDTDNFLAPDAAVCETTERTAGFFCAANDLVNGCLRVFFISFSGDYIEKGSGPIFSVSYDVALEAPEGECRDLTVSNDLITDNSSQRLTVTTEPGRFCFSEPVDSDNDGLYDNEDNCPEDYNPDQEDSDNDTVGDLCDNCPGIYNPGQVDTDNDTVGDACDICADDPLNDFDNDTVCGDADNCPEDANPDQVDTDNDTVGDACDICADDPDNDLDMDGICHDADNCPLNYNPDQMDTDNDTAGDVCDEFPNDFDNDGVDDNLDNCLFDNNTDQADTDNDTIGDICDNCPGNANPDQADSDNNGIGDACDGSSEDGGNNGNSEGNSDGTPAVGGGGGSGSSRPAPPECADNSDCDNAYFCDGVEKCEDGRCIEGDEPCMEGETCDEDYEECVAPVPAPECLSDSDCDDRIFCNGEEECSDGECIDGEVPCDSEQICMEDEARCWDFQEISAFSVRKSLLRPVFRKKRCTSLVLKIEGDADFDRDSSMITVKGEEYGSSGVTVDSEGEAYKAFGFIFVPVCIERQATTGEWKVEIKTSVSDADNPYGEMIEAGFEIR